MISEAEFIKDVVKASVDGEILSNSDIQSIVEAYVIQHGGDESVLLDKIHNGIDVRLNPPPMAREWLWSNNDLDNALQYIQARPYLREQLLDGIMNTQDRGAVNSVISDGWAESFDKYDSDVVEQFIQQYKKIFTE